MNTSILALANKIFETCLINSEDKTTAWKAVISEAVSFTTYYLIAAENTSLEEWEDGLFKLYTDPQHNLTAFIDKEDAERFAKQNGFFITRENNLSVMVMDMSREEFAKRIQQLKSEIDGVKIYVKRLLYVICPFESFDVPNQEYEEKSGTEKKMLQPLAEAESKKTFILVDEIKAFLDAADISERRAIDQNLSWENLHFVIERLIAKNQIDMQQLEQELDLPQGWLDSFCKDKTSAAASKPVLKKLLDYFDLGEYLYHYKNYCTELLQEIKKGQSIDKYEIKPSTADTNNAYKIMSVQRGKIPKDNAYVYKLIMKSEKDVQEVFVSTSKGYVTGKSYEIAELDGKKSKPEQISRTADEKKESPPINKPVAQRYVPRAEARGGKRDVREQLEKDTQDIIRYFKEKYGDNAAAANEKALKLLKHEDIFRAFAQFTRKKGPGRIRVANYSPGRLMNELKFEPYEAYCILIDLRENPKDTKQMLLYRERDPQYQKKN